ncbi:kelch repeat protein, partial [Cooperia oncophora]
TTYFVLVGGSVEVVLVGGSVEDEELCTVECLDPAKAEAVWEYVAPMSTPRHGAGVAVLDNLLYAVGGYDGRTWLSSVESYDAERNKWIRVAPMQTARQGLSVSVLNGCLYAMGGEHNDLPLTTVE